MSDFGSRQQSIFEELTESQWWSTEQIEAHRRARTKMLARHAAANASFYEERLGPFLLAPEEAAEERWLRLPTVSRSDLVQHRVGMHARTLSSEHGRVATSSSSGSTGLAVSVTTTALATMVDNATRWRAHRRFRFDWRRNVCSRQEIDPSKALWPDGMRLGAWGPPWLSESTGVAWRIYKGTSAERTFQFMLAHDCGYLNVGSKTAHALALEAERLGVKARLDGILAQGEGCDAEDKEACLRVFGAQIMEHYSSKEMGQAAHPCELGTLHVNEENVFIEILDEHGNPCRPGQAGRVVVTPFFSMAQPLIRYEQGDVAVFGERCACGRSSRTIQRVIGRTAAIFRHPDGRAVSRLLPNVARDALHCSMMQVAQVGPTAFEIRYVPDGPDSQPDELLVRQIFHREYFDDADVRLVRVARIEPQESGKIAQYLNEYSQG